MTGVQTCALPILPVAEFVPSETPSEMPEEMPQDVPQKMSQDIPQEMSSINANEPYLSSPSTLYQDMMGERNEDSKDDLLNYGDSMKPQLSNQDESPMDINGKPASQKPVHNEETYSDEFTRNQTNYFRKPEGNMKEIVIKKIDYDKDGYKSTSEKSIDVIKLTKGENDEPIFT